MLTTEKEKRICKKYSAVGDNGKVNCKSCPLVKDLRLCLCKANSHYDRHTRRWEEGNEAEVQE